MSGTEAAEKCTWGVWEEGVDNVRLPSEAREDRFPFSLGLWVTGHLLGEGALFFAPDGWLKPSSPPTPGVLCTLELTSPCLHKRCVMYLLSWYWSECIYAFVFPGSLEESLLQFICILLLLSMIFVRYMFSSAASSCYTVLLSYQYF